MLGGPSKTLKFLVTLYRDTLDQIEYSVHSEIYQDLNYASPSRAIIGEGDYRTYGEFMEHAAHGNRLEHVRIGKEFGLEVANLISDTGLSDLQVDAKTTLSS